MRCFNRKDEWGHRRNFLWLVILTTCLGAFFMFISWEFGIREKKVKNQTFSEWKQEKKVEAQKAARIRCDNENKTVINDLCNPCDVPGLTTKCSMNCFFTFDDNTINSTKYNKSNCEAEFWRGNWIY